MARWLIQVSEKLQPIWNLLEEKVLSNDYLAIDASYVQVLKEKNKRAQSKSFMWGRGSPEQGIILFDYDVSGGGEVARRLLLDYKGTVQGDAHRGYGKLNKENIDLIGCMMHARRRFFKAWVKGQKRAGLASEGLNQIQEIYKKEEEYKKSNLSPELRKIKRDEEVKPLLENLRNWCKENQSKVLKSTPVGNAIHYFLNEYTEISGFLKNGRYEIDNGWIERQIKRFAIGRKNWMFSVSEEGAHTSALLYSLVITIKLNGKNPYEVLTEVLKRIPTAKTLKDYETITQLLLSPVPKNSILKKEGKLI